MGMLVRDRNVGLILWGLRAHLEDRVEGYKLGYGSGSDLTRALEQDGLYAISSDPAPRIYWMIELDYGDAYRPLFLSMLYPALPLTEVEGTQEAMGLIGAHLGASEMTRRGWRMQA